VDKSPDAFRTISEVAEHLDTPAHVLRFWESRFPQIRPVKRAGGRRYYRPSDIALLTGIKRLLHDEGMTIRGVQKILRDHGVRHVAGLQDESVSVADIGILSGAKSVQDEVGSTAPADDEAGFIEVVDDEDEEATLPPPSSARPAPVQPSLPLFEAAAAPWVQREDVTVAALIRALPRGALKPARAPVTALAGRLATLRARMVEHAEGGTGRGT
jgi:DNA-binding transcriptional MerR regulator